MDSRNNPGAQDRSQISCDGGWVEEMDGKSSGKWKVESGKEIPSIKG